MRIGSLFSGIGGLELGLERAGLGPVVFQVEANPFCRTVLEKHWPSADRSVTDVREANASNLAKVDVICGGFPCQDISNAGKRVGIDGPRSGLWREYARIIRDLRPRFVFVENVAALLVRGVADVLRDLAELGYDAEWAVFRASDAGAPHRRARLFILAQRGQVTGAGRRGAPLADAMRGVGCGNGEVVDEWICDATDARDGSQDVAHAERDGLNRRPTSQCGSAQEVEASNDPRSGRARLAQSGVGRVPPRLPHRLDGDRWPAGLGEVQRDWEPPRTVSQVADRPARLTALGNAVVPACAELAWCTLLARADEGVTA